MDRRDFLKLALGALALPALPYLKNLELLSKVGPHVALGQKPGATSIDDAGRAIMDLSYDPAAPDKCYTAVLIRKREGGEWVSLRRVPEQGWYGPAWSKDVEKWYRLDAVPGHDDWGVKQVLVIDGWRDDA